MWERVIAQIVLKIKGQFSKEKETTPLLSLNTKMQTTIIKQFLKFGWENKKHWVTTRAWLKHFNTSLDYTVLILMVFYLQQGGYALIHCYFSRQLHLCSSLVGILFPQAAAMSQLLKVALTKSPLFYIWVRLEIQRLGRNPAGSKRLSSNQVPFSPCWCLWKPCASA